MSFCLFICSVVGGFVVHLSLFMALLIEHVFARAVVADVVVADAILCLKLQKLNTSVQFSFQIFATSELLIITSKLLNLKLIRFCILLQFNLI